MTELSSSNVFLRMVEEGDLAKRVEWINDPAVQATLTFDYPTSLARTRVWFQRIVLDGTRRDFTVFTVDGDPIGFCGLIQIDPMVRKAELYVIIGNRNYWQSGYGTNVYKLLMSYGFEEMGLNRIYAYQLTNNKGAHRAVEKLGWQREGLLRSDVMAHGQLADRFVVSILKQDWDRLHGRLQ